jgi:hypothetical protein
MAGMPWIKLYGELLHDPKLSHLPESVKWRYIQLLLLAGECDALGALVKGEDNEPMTAEDIAWILHLRPGRVKADLKLLENARLVSVVCSTCVIPAFEKRQGRTQDERRAEWRERKAREKADKPDGITRESRVNLTPRLDIEEDIEKRREDKDIAVATAPPAPAASSPPNKPAKTKTAPKQSDNYRPIFGWLNDLCQINAPARIGATAKKIDDTGATLEACQKFERWWWAIDWRAQKNPEQRPTPEQVWQEWPKSVAWDGTIKPSGNGRKKGIDASTDAVIEAMNDPRWNEENN